MAQDSFGNYVAGIVYPDISPLPHSMFGGSSGIGVPNNADGNNGDTYVDLNTGDLYTKSGDVWNIVTGAAGGSGLSGTVDPEGVVAAAAGTTYVNRTLKSLWVKETGGAGTTTFWQQYV